jgi:hypothetical protein
MVHTQRLMELFDSADTDPIDEQRLRRLAYEAFEGDSLLLMTTLLRTIHSLAEQLGNFYGSSAEDVLRIEAILPTSPAS